MQRQNFIIRRISYGIAVLLIISYFKWVAGLPEYHNYKVNGQLAAVEVIGRNQNRGNLLGIQPWMVPTDYTDDRQFKKKLKLYFEAAKQRGLITPNKTIVILPEYLGTWLVAAGEKQSVFEAKSVQDALTTMVLSSPLNFWKAYRQAPVTVDDKVKYAVFTMKANKMAEAYQYAFDHLAAMYEVTIVAGSILLPNPQVQGNKLTVTEGPLYNVSAIFHPDGRLDSQLIKKVYPINDELPFVCPTKPDQVPVFDTPAGRLGVLVCADSWNSPVYRTLKQKGATLLAVPSFSAGDKVWQTTWKGYSGTPTPADARAHVGKLTEGQAWLAHAMAGRAKPEGGIKKGINVFLRGKLWDLGSDGTTVVLNDSIHTTRPVNGATLTCLWL